MTLEKKQELTLKITQANKTRMITILYEMVMQYLDDAISALEAGERKELETALSHAQSCIDELIHSLNLEYELARNLMGIYLFSKKELLAAGVREDAGRIARVKKNFESLHGAYLELEKMDTSDKLMGNTQKVYAGLTYGKYALNEDITAASANRGFKA